MPDYVNKMTLDTSRGFREIRLVRGDISTSPDELVVLSSHANPTMRPAGATIRAVANRYDLQELTLSPVVTVPEMGAAGTYTTESSRGGLPFEILITRTPGIDWISRIGAAPVSVYEEVIWSLFSTIAALELKKHRFARISVPLIGGQRGFPREPTMKVLLDGASEWLHRARHTERITFYGYERDEISKWDEAMNRVLGRTYLDVAQGQAVIALQQEVLALLADPPYDEAKFEEIVSPLCRLLRDSDDQVCLKQVGSFARSLVEEVVREVLEKHDLEWERKLYKDIQTLFHEDLVAPWIVNHCHTLRVFGNESLHARGDVSYVPERVNENDVVTILTSLHRLLQFYKSWRQQ